MGETLPLDPWAHQGMEISDRPTILPITHDPNISDKVMYLQMAFKQRPLRDGGGKPSLGRLARGPDRCPKQQCWVLTSPWGDKLQESLSLGEGSPPFPEELLEDIRRFWRRGGRPTLLPGHLAQRASEHSGPRPPVSRDLEQGAPLGVTDPPLTSPGIWPLKKELKGEEPEFQQLPQRAGETTSADHFSKLIRGTFLEEVPMGMVEGPFSKEAAASRCGCASEDLCPGLLAGIDEGNKIRTIYDGSVGGANDTIRNQTVERTTAPTVLDAVQALHWLHAAAEEGPPSQGGIVKPPPAGWLWPEPGTRWVLLKADVTKAYRRVKVLRKDWGGS